MTKHSDNANAEASTHLLIFGLGYSATAIARYVDNRFDVVTATNRSIVEKHSKFYQHLIFDGFQLDDTLAEAIMTATHILISIGPDGNGDPVLRASERLLKSAKRLQWIGYLSTVGVYGNHNGAWVDETTKCQPLSRRSVERLKVEEHWQAMAQTSNIPLAIFRLSGIYGPARNAFVKIEQGHSRKLIKEGQVFNRIHRDDIVQMVSRAIELNVDGIFNITDNEPAPPQDVIAYAHQLHGSVSPPAMDFETAELPPMTRSFYGENKRVSNAKSRSVLGLDYIWPNYRVALAAMWNNNVWR